MNRPAIAVVIRVYARPPMRMALVEAKKALPWLSDASSCASTIRLSRTANCETCWLEARPQREMAELEATTTMTAARAATMAMTINPHFHHHDQEPQPPKPLSP